MTPDHARAKSIPPTADSAPRVRLRVQSGIGEGTAIECRRIVTILGSRPGCKVLLKHQRVSPVHLAIVNTGSGVVALDLVNRAGTQLNGLKMEHERLTDGDIIRIKPWEFRVEITDPEHKGDADAHPVGLEPSPNVVALELVASGRILQPNRDVCLVGRRSGCDITISDRQVSRVHALLMNYFGHPAILDLLSHNQTLVNGVPICFENLTNDDIVEVGDTEFRVRLVGSAVSESVSNNGRRTAEPVDPPVAGESEGDMIDIGEVEGAQRWKIVDSLQRASRKK